VVIYVKVLPEDMQNTDKILLASLSTHPLCLFCFALSQAGDHDQLKCWRDIEELSIG
jgi:hypothetical protein